MEQATLPNQQTDIAGERPAPLGIEIATEEERQLSIRGAIDSPAITCEFVGNSVRDSLYATVSIPASEVRLDKIPSYSRERLEAGEPAYLAPSTKIEDITKPEARDDIYAAEAESAGSALESAITSSVPELRLASSDIFQTAVEKGCALRQLLEFEFSNGSDVSLANLSHVDIAPEQQEGLRELLDKINDFTKGGVSNYPKSLFVVPHEVLQDIRGKSDLGERYDINAYANNGRIVLSDKLFQPGQKADKEYAEEYDEYLSTIAHEFGHLMEKFSDPEISFAEQIGWEARTYDLADGAQHTIHGIGTKHMHDEDVKPVSWYGNTKPGEDFAETFAALVLGRSVDDVRRKAVVNNVMDPRKTHPKVVPKIEGIKTRDATSGQKFGLVPEGFRKHYKIRFGYIAKPA